MLGELYVYLPEKRELVGPWSDRKLDRVISFARIGSQFGGPRIVVWQKPDGSRVMIRRYVGGERDWPVDVDPASRRRMRRKIAGRSQQLSETQFNRLEQMGLIEQTP